MHRLFESHIRGLLNEKRPKSVLEIGVLRGQNTLNVLEWCAENGAHLTSLDPVQWEGALPEEVKRPLAGYRYKRGQEKFNDVKIVPEFLETVFKRGLDRHWTCLKYRSVDYLALPEYPGFDMYLIDGDHNYYTVSTELRLIHGKASNHPVLLFNDVAGAWARKDLYYDPSLIPDTYRDGPKQGVLTAIEDFMDGLSRKRWFWRVGCPYRFKILTLRHDGLGLLEHIGNENGR